MSYREFVKTKTNAIISAGFDPGDMWFPEKIKPFQRDIVKLSCKRGRSAIFADTGLGKTLMQLAWAYLVQEYTDKPVIVLAPLCVANQTVREGEKFGIESEYIRHPKFTNSRIHVVNYEMMHNFNPSDYGGIVLDESSILKGMNGKLRKAITEFGAKIPYRLSCTATPSPNDFMEIGTQSEFLGVMSQTEMLAMFFIHDGSDTAKWRLKGHAIKRFWEWMATWSVVIRNPGDLGYKDGGYDLPPLNFHEHIIHTDTGDQLFATIAQGLQDRGKARRDSVQLRCEKAAEIMAGFQTSIAWCNLNSESELISKMSGSVEITGSMKPEIKEERMMGFIDRTIKSITTKPKIAGYGMNLQHCNNMVFVGLSDSFEQFYQAVRRCWRYGQTEPVDVHIVVSDREGGVLSNIKRKQDQHDQMVREMALLMSDITKAEIAGSAHGSILYKPEKIMIKPLFSRGSL